MAARSHHAGVSIVPGCHIGVSLSFIGAPCAEDALVNVSVEKQPDGKLAGFIRIRSKTQGIALSLGDKLILRQKG